MAKRNLPAARIMSPLGMDSIRSEYDMARENRFRRRRQGVTSIGRSADSHFITEQDLIRSREYVRDMARNDSVIGPMVEQAVTQTVQTGFTLNPTTANSDCNNLIKELWYEWAEDPDQCDIAGEHAFEDMEAIVFRSMLIDGDSIGIGTNTGALQIHEAHRLRTPTKSQKNIVHGVELDDNRRRLNYYFAKESVDLKRAYERLYDFDPIPTRDSDGFRQVFHVYHTDRVSQTRGVTALKAIVDIATMVGDMAFAQLIKEQFSAMVVGFLKRNGDYIADSQMGERGVSQLPDGTTQTIEQLEPGMLVRGNKGEELNLSSANVTSQSSMQFVRYLLQILGMNLGLPLIVATMDASQSSWSSARVDLDQARMGFRKNQHELVRRWHKPVYEWWLNYQLYENKHLQKYFKELGKGIFKHDWKTPRWPYIDPMKDSAANALRLTTLQSSPRRIASESGQDFDEISVETAEDRKTMWDHAFTAYKALCKLHPEAAKSLTPRDMLNLDLYKGGQVIDSADTDNNKKQNQNG